MDIKDVDRNVQHLFSDVLQEDEHGRLWANYYDENNNIIDHEIWSISKLKLSSGGILSFSTAHSLSARSLYVSDSVANLILFVQSYASRFSWEYAAFIATGTKLDRDLFMEAVGKYPYVKKHYSVYGHSLIGRVRDCKVQHWLNGEDCFFRTDGEMVVACYQGKDFRLAVSRFSLRNHLRQLGLRQNLKTKKPRTTILGNFSITSAGM